MLIKNEQTQLRWLTLPLMRSGYSCPENAQPLSTPTSTKSKNLASTTQKYDQIRFFRVKGRLKGGRNGSIMNRTI